MDKYCLTMTEKQARTVIDALDFFMRMRIGQWDELINLCTTYEAGKDTEYLHRREVLSDRLFEARCIAMPELTRNASWGVYKFEQTERAFDVLKAVRSAIAWHYKPEGGYEVIYDRPCAINVAEEMPTCEVVEDERQNETDSVSD